MTTKTISRRQAPWIISVGALCASIFAIGVIVINVYTQIIRPDPQRTKNIPHAENVTDVHVASLREQEAWTPEDFFETPDAIRACQLISNREHEGLQKLVDSGLNVNLSGTAGMTLLHWAFADDNLEAFKLLLASGADPDQRLSDMIKLRNGWFFGGDSILFTCMRSTQKTKWDFFFAALEYTKNVNQLDGAGNTLLLVCMGPRAIFSTSEETLQRILDSGVELDAQGKHGETAAMVALSWDRPLLCLRILKAGADPDIRDKNGRTVRDLVSNQLQNYKRSNRPIPVGMDELKEWLNSRGDRASP